MPVGSNLKLYVMWRSSVLLHLKVAIGPWKWMLITARSHVASLSVMKFFVRFRFVQLLQWDALTFRPLWMKINVRSVVGN